MLLCAVFSCIFSALRIFFGLLCNLCLVVKKMESNKIPPLAIFLASDAGASVSGQIFGVRANEIYLFTQPRIVRAVHRLPGWTPESIAEHAIPALTPHFFANEPSMSVTPWDPI